MLIPRLRSSSSICQIDVIQEGDSLGNNTILLFKTSSGRSIHAIGVPQDFHSSLGPTWVYAVASERDGITLVDAGCRNSMEILIRALHKAGLTKNVIRRVFLTHSHSDHDGAAMRLAEYTGAELWAHELYKLLLPFSTGDIGGQANAFVLETLRKHNRKKDPLDEPTELDVDDWLQSDKPHNEMRQQMTIHRALIDGERWSDFAFYSTPGHSPDELTIALDEILFTGDHILPEITPLPTVKTSYPVSLKNNLPMRYQDPELQYGLATYIRSLIRIARFGKGYTILPAHRLISKGRINLITPHRANLIVHHHFHRMRRIMAFLGSVDRTVLEITYQLFASRELKGENLFLAVSEVIAHLEFMIDAADVEILPDRRIRWLGTNHCLKVLDSMIA